MIKFKYVLYLNKLKPVYFSKCLAQPGSLTEIMCYSYLL